MALRKEIKNYYKSEKIDLDRRILSDIYNFFEKFNAIKSINNLDDFRSIENKTIEKIYHDIFEDYNSNNDLHSNTIKSKHCNIRNNLIIINKKLDVNMLKRPYRQKASSSRSMNNYTDAEIIAHVEMNNKTDDKIIPNNETTVDNSVNNEVTTNVDINIENIPDNNTDNEDIIYLEDIIIDIIETDIKESDIYKSMLVQLSKMQKDLSEEEKENYINYWFEILKCLESNIEDIKLCEINLSVHNIRKLKDIIKNKEDVERLYLLFKDLGNGKRNLIIDDTYEILDLNEKESDNNSNSSDRSSNSNKYESDRFDPPKNESVGSSANSSRNREKSSNSDDDSDDDKFK